MMKNFRYFLIISLIITTAFVAINSCHKEDENDPPTTPITGTVTDMEGNIYKTVVIGSQIWMAENLRSTKYRNGDSIPNIIDGEQWINLTSGAFCDYDNYSTLGFRYGKLYNWYAVQDERNLAPQGWHVATDEEWNVLGKYIGYNNSALAGLKIKEAGAIHWATGFFTNPGTNETGFTALPGGFRWGEPIAYEGTFRDIRYVAYWWTLTEATSEKARCRKLSYSGFFWDEGDSRPCDGGTACCNDKNYGFSVRCVKD